jgi:hypothetical protein
VFLSKLVCKENLKKIKPRFTQAIGSINNIYIVVDEKALNGRVQADC